MTTRTISGVQHYIGVAADVKPTAGVPDGSTFHEADTDLDFIFLVDTWYSGKAVQNGASVLYVPSLVAVTKTLTLDGSAGNGAIGSLPIFTTSGRVKLEAYSAYGSALVGAGATIKFGTTNATAAIAAASSALDATNGFISAGATPGPAVGDLISLLGHKLDISENVVGTIATHALSGSLIVKAQYSIDNAAGALVGD